MRQIGHAQAFPMHPFERQVCVYFKLQTFARNRLGC
jgi:hypothetical protein